MRLPEVLGALGALVVGAVLAVFLLTSALGEQPALPSPTLPSLPPLPTFALSSRPPSVAPGTPITSDAPVVGLEIGQKAPPLEVTLLDGSTMNTADFVGKPMWINFMATWCPQCRDELPMMSNYAELLGDQMNILVVDVGENRDTVKAFMKDLNFKQLVGVDDGTAQRAWGTYALPVHYWLDADGIVQDVVYGGAPPQIFIEAITDLVPDFSANFPTPTPLIPVVPTFSFPPVESPSPTAADQG